MPSQLMDSLKTQVDRLYRVVMELERFVRNVRGSGIVFSPGQILAGGRNVRIDKNGITLQETTAASPYLRFTDSSGTQKSYLAEITGAGVILKNEDSSLRLDLHSVGDMLILADGADSLTIQHSAAGQAILLRTEMTNSDSEIVTIREDPGTANKHQLDVSLGAAGAKITIGGDIEIHGSSGGAVYIKERTAALGDTAGLGQIWVKNTAPCQLWFTDDEGADTQLA